MIVSRSPRKRGEEKKKSKKTQQGHNLTNLCGDFMDFLLFSQIVFFFSARRVERELRKDQASLAGNGQPKIPQLKHPEKSSKHQKNLKKIGSFILHVKNICFTVSLCVCLVNCQTTFFFLSTLTERTPPSRAAHSSAKGTGAVPPCCRGENLG